MTNDGSSGYYRLFIAIQVPAAVREEMLRVQRQLESLTPRGSVRWTKPEQFHLTLRFLGDVPSHSVSAMQKSVRAVCVDASSLQLRAQGVGFFPHARAPRVIWIGIIDNENRLLELQKKIGHAVRSFSTQPAEQRFAGHVTLGRFKSFNSLNVKGLQLSAETLKQQVFGQWTAHEIEIVRSELHETGPRHRPIEVLQLGTELAS